VGFSVRLGLLILLGADDGRDRLSLSTRFDSDVGCCIVVNSLEGSALIAIYDLLSLEVHEVIYLVAHL